MSRWWLVLLLGWLSAAALGAHLEYESRREAARFEEACRCQGNVRTYSPDDEQRVATHDQWLGKDPTAAATPPRPPALRSFRVEAPQRDEPNGMDPLTTIRLDSELDPAAAWHELTFRIKPPDASADPRVLTYTAMVKGGDLSEVGVPHCDGALRIFDGDHVSLSVRSFDRAGNASAEARIGADATLGGARYDSCLYDSHARCGCGTGWGIVLLLMLLAPVTVGLGIISLIVLFVRRSRINDAEVEPFAADAALRLAAIISREQAGVAAVCLVSAIAVTVIYPLVALAGLAMAILGLIPLSRWKTMRRFEKMAAATGALIERKGQRIFAVHDGTVVTFECAASDLRRASAEVIPPAQARQR